MKHNKHLDPWPVVYKESITLLDPTQKIAIITLWTQQEYVMQYINTSAKKKISVVANAFNKVNALKPMLVNLLSNRNIRYLIICGLDRTGSKQAILEFLNKKNKDIDEDIKEYVLDVREQIHKIVTCEMEEVSKHVELLYKESIKLEPYHKQPIDCKQILETKQVYEWDHYGSGYIRRERDVYHLYIRLLKLIMTKGEVNYMSANKARETRHVSNLVAVIESLDEKFTILPELRKLIPMKTLRHYTSSFNKIEKEEGQSYTYGGRAHNYFQVVVDLLKSNIYTKRAYIPIFYPEDKELVNKPCASSISFLYINGRLNMTVFFRSHDIYRAWIMNIFGFRSFQVKVCKKLKVPIGHLTTVSHSAQIYKENYDIALKIVNEYGFSVPTRYFDTEGYFTVQTAEEDIVIFYYNNQDKLLFKWTKHYKQYQDLIFEIADHINDPHHIAYVSREITIKFFDLSQKKSKSKNKK